MKASQAKIVILLALKDFNEQRPSKRDFTSLARLLNGTKPQIRDIDFARSVIDSLVEDKHIDIAPNREGQTSIFLRINKLGLEYLDKNNKNIFNNIKLFCLRDWRYIFSMIVTIIGIIVIPLFIYYKSITKSKPSNKERTIKYQAIHKADSKHI